MLIPQLNNTEYVVTVFSVKHFVCFYLCPYAHFPYINLCVQWSLLQVTQGLNLYMHNRT